MRLGDLALPRRFNMKLGQPIAYARVTALAILTAASAWALPSAPARADYGRLNLNVDLGAGLPTAGYLAPPGKDDRTGHFGLVGQLSLDYVLVGPLAIEVTGGAGYMFDLVSGNPPGVTDPISGFVPWNVGLGLRLRFLDKKDGYRNEEGGTRNGNLWVSAHIGAYGWDATRFGADAAIGYDWSVVKPMSIGVFARYAIIANAPAGVFESDSRVNSAIYAGISFGFELLGDPEPPEPEVDTDADDDGIDDAVDQCPNDPEDIDGDRDEDGCPETPEDIDGDGILNEADACPEVAEDRDGFEDEDGCPELDNDQDGIPDLSDRCALEPEDMDGFEDEDGCPDADNDQDGVTDGVDECVNEAGPIENRGCPDSDRDGDTVVDRLDNCPDVAGTVENHGCQEQQRVVITGDRLQIMEKVYFRTGSHRIERRSNELLDQVAAVLNAHPEILRVRVEGHTDSRGNDARNLRLSQRRAQEVVRYLTRRGHVDADRLEAVGFGEQQPVTPNAETDEEHETNRRVEFVITEQQRHGAQAQPQPQQP
jgi:outer membrane protein OmpA-like peptidoglycan-associated protein